MSSTLDCERARELIHLRLDGGLAADAACELQDHLATCEACDEFEHEQRSLADALRNELSGITAPARPAPDLQRELNATRPCRLRPRHVWAVAAIAVVAAVMAGLHFARSHPPAVALSGPPLHVFAQGASISRTVHVGEALREDDLIWGSDEAWASLRLADGGRVELSEDAVVQIRRRSLSISKGSLRADLTGTAKPLAFATRWGTASASGAAFSLIVLPGGDGVRLAVDEGTVSIRSDGPLRTVGPGESVTFSGESAAAA